MVVEEEGNSTTAICVHLMSGIIAPNITVDYSIDIHQENATQGLPTVPYELVWVYMLRLVDVILDTGTGVMTALDSTVCHHITIIDNNVVEPDGEVVIIINQSSLNPPTTEISSSIATVNIINDDGKIIKCWCS